MRKQLFRVLTPLFLLPAITFIATAQRELRDKNTLYNKKPEFSSPNAASVEKYVEFPTANYTGVPDISIPLAQVGVKSVNVPVTLSYHASGIKVDDIASDVGSGWSLSYGGSINIIVNGLRDEQYGFPYDQASFNKIKNLSFQYGYNGGTISCMDAMLYTDPLGPDPLSLYSGGDFYYLSNVVNGFFDSEPDIYTFSFMGRSGKFFKDENGVFRCMPHSELKIESIRENNMPKGYKITDESGTIYEFKAAEGGTESSNSLSDIYHVSTRESLTYNLSKVITALGETIEFFYSGQPFTYDLQKTFTRARTSLGSTCWQLNSNGNYFSQSTVVSSMYSGGTRIDSIKTSKDGLIIFKYSTANRTDIPRKSLESVEQWNLNNDRVKISSFQFSYNYSTGRLTLASVQETGKPATSFEYDQYALPPRLSYEQDHYGYYNGKPNNTLLPIDEYWEFWDGADRSVVPMYTQAGMLKKINHPTGGVTELVYENNEIFISTPTTTYPKVVGAYRASIANTTVSQNFTVTANSRKIRIDHTNSYDGSQIHNDYCIIRITGPNNYSRQFLGNSNRNTAPLDLVPGQYTLSIENVGNTYSADATVFWFEETVVPPHNEMGGGVRIKEIKKYDGVSTTPIIKTFTYKLGTTANSSGTATITPIYVQFKGQQIKRQGDGSAYSSCTTISCDYLEQSSNSVAPLAFANGNYVSYSEVTVSDGSLQNNGFTRYKYNVTANGFNTGIGYAPYAPRIMYDWTDGILLEKEDYGIIDNQTKILKKTKNIYNYTLFDPQNSNQVQYTNYGAKITIQDAPFICWSVCSSSLVLGTYFDPMSFAIQRYQLYSSWHRLEQTEETNYDYSGNAIVNVTKFYYGSNHLNPVEIETTNSKGQKVSVLQRYAKDLSTNNGIISSLVAKNIIAAPLERLNTAIINGVKYVTGGEITGYSPTNLLLLPDKVYKLELDNPLPLSSFSLYTVNAQNALQMDNRYTEAASLSYDIEGNVKTYYKLNDICHSYVYDYMNAYPVAEVSNACGGQYAYTSFESDGKGGWQFTGAPVYDASSKQFTGERYYSLSAGQITANGLTQAKYTVSFWKTGTGIVSVNGASPSKVSQPINGWTYMEFTLNTNSVVISGNASIDELRLYPAGAMMSTCTYKPSVGITSKCDANNKVVYYEYDALNRLKLTRDQDNNILQVFNYQYQATPNQ